MFGAMAVCMLLWVALYNGYPTVYPDTGGYLYTGWFFVAFHPFRAPGYAIFQRLASLGTSAWFIVALQAIIVISVLYETCKHLAGGRSRFTDRFLFASVGALAVLTSLPWETSQLMPDVFAGVVFLAAFLLARDGRLQRGERLALAAILCVSVSAHMSLLPIAILFSAALILFQLAAGRISGAPSAKAAAAWLLAPILAAGFCTAALNRSMGLGFKVSVSGNEFFLGSLFDKGLAAEFLQENCGTKSFVACRYLGDLPKTPGEFLFWHPLLHDMQGHRNEVQELVRGTIAAHPFLFVERSGRDTLRQIVSFRTGDEIRETHSPNSNGVVIQQVLPRDARAFANAKQGNGRFDRLTRVAAVLDTLAFWASALGCCVFAWRGRAKSVNALFYSAGFFLLINAGVCATFAGVYDRYQSRVAWLIPFCLVCYVFSLFREQKTARPRQRLASQANYRREEISELVR